jgi:hypothetical protein
MNTLLITSHTQFTFIAATYSIIFYRICALSSSLFPLAVVLCSEVHKQSVTRHKNLSKPNIQTINANLYRVSIVVTILDHVILYKLKIK